MRVLGERESPFGDDSIRASRYSDQTTQIQADKSTTELEPDKELSGRSTERHQSDRENPRPVIRRHRSLPTAASIPE
jgi:hypothetical protein